MYVWGTSMTAPNRGPRTDPSSCPCISTKCAVASTAEVLLRRSQLATAAAPLAVVEKIAGFGSKGIDLQHQPQAMYVLNNQPRAHFLPGGSLGGEERAKGLGWGRGRGLDRSSRAWHCEASECREGNSSACCRDDSFKAKFMKKPVSRGASARLIWTHVRLSAPPLWEVT